MFLGRGEGTNKEWGREKTKGAGNKKEWSGGKSDKGRQNDRNGFEIMVTNN